MKIQTKLFLLLTGFSLVLILAFALFIRWNMSKEMTSYIHKKELEVLTSFQQDLVEIYQLQNSWQPLVDKKSDFRDLLFRHVSKHRFLLPPRPNHPAPNKPQPPRPAQESQQEKGEDVFKSLLKELPPERKRQIRSRLNYLLLDADETLLIGRQQPKREYRRLPISDGKTTIGYLAFPNKRPMPKGAELEFIEHQTQDLWLMTFVLMGLVIIFTIPLARHLVRPLETLAESIHQLTKGNFSLPVFAKRKDEIGQLQDDHLELAATLKQNETIRNQWLANTSHELRTPIAVLRGELEAMLDGVRPINQSNINSILHEVDHLQKLVNDLHLLNQATVEQFALNMEPLEVAKFVDECVQDMTGYLTSNHIDCHFQVEQLNDLVNIDTSRFKQVIENIVNNAVKYAGNQSRLDISLSKKGKHIQVTFEDNGQGVETEQLPYLFDHLYRAENSRNRKTGGSGLGLAICKQIVLNHQGEISAFHSSLGGLGINIKVPCYEPN